MPQISKIRLSNIGFEGGQKRFNDEIFYLDGENAVLLLENGGGKTVLVQTILQAVLPHETLADRKPVDTYQLHGTCAHVAVEWIIHPHPRRYAVTAVTLFLTDQGLNSYRYIYQYEEGDAHGIEHIPFVRKASGGGRRPASREEMADYYGHMKQNNTLAHTFDTIKAYHKALEEELGIVPAEWKNIAIINAREGGVEEFFDRCRTGDALVHSLLIPAIEGVIVGEKGTEFAETFEKHRDHFRKFKELQWQIEESQSLDKELARYAQGFLKQHEAETRLQRVKSQAKTLHHHGKTEIETQEKFLEQLAKQGNQLRTTRQRWIWRYDCLDWAKVVRKQETLALKLDKATEQWQEALEEEIQAGSQYASFLWARFQQQLEELDYQVKRKEEALKSLDQSPNAAKLNNALDHCRGELRHAYDQQEINLRQVQETTDAALKSLEEDRRHLRDTIRHEREKHQQMVQQQSQYQGQLDLLVGQQQQTEKEVLAFRKEEGMKEAFHNLRRELEEMENKQHQLEREEQMMGEGLKKLEAELEQLQEAKSTQLQLVEKWNERWEQQSHAMDAMRNALLEWLPGSLGSHQLYSQEATLSERLAESIQEAQRKKEEAILEEHQKQVLYREHSQQDLFVADPELQQLVERGQGKVFSLELGVDFVARSTEGKGLSADKRLKRMPWWTAVVMVDEGELGQCRTWLESQRHHITLPLLLITHQEGRSLLDASEDDLDLQWVKALSGQRWVAPGMWEELLNRENFHHWKKTVGDEARRSEDHRKEMEDTLREWDRRQQQWQRFIMEYPHQQWRETRESLRKAKQTLEQISQDITKTGIGKQQQVQALKKLEQQLKETRETKEAIDRLLEKAQHWMEREQMVCLMKGQLKTVMASLASVHETLVDLEQKSNKLEIQIKEKGEALYRQQMKLESLLDEKGYTETRDVMPVESSKSKAVLYQEMQDLESRLNHTVQGRAQLEQSLQGLKDQQRDKKSDLERFQRDTIYPIDKDDQFPDVDHSTEMALSDALEVRKEERKTKETAKNKYLEEYKQVSVREDTKRGELLKRYENLAAFSADLEEEERALDAEKKLIAQQEEALVEDEEKTVKQLEEMKESFDYLDRKSEAYYFLDESIDWDMDFSALAKRDYAYGRKAMVVHLVEEMAKAQKEYAAAEERIRIARDLFEGFCRTRLRDPKLKGMALQGARQHRSLETMTHWQQMLDDRIQMTIRVAEDSQRDSDVHLNQLIALLHRHLVTLVRELKSIPNKTRIKVEDTWKNIYELMVPDWEEAEGKRQLRNHLDHLAGVLDELEKQEQLTEEREKGEGRKMMERALQSQNLLGVVMGGEKIKVKCRKVTNNRQVVLRPVSWEESNRWSGGEKWSKNMALFLGLLNYLAEKRRRYLSATDVSRSVILDNPFGKASSEHVLDPVFFIARQLGFQIIALTAHADGQFIRDYFPVVYSCRLRPASDGHSQVVDKQLKLASAYFQDQDPVRLSRLGALEQMEIQ